MNSFGENILFKNAISNNKFLCPIKEKKKFLNYSKLYQRPPEDSEKKKIVIMAENENVSGN